MERLIACVDRVAGFVEAETASEAELVGVVLAAHSAALTFHAGFRRCRIGRPCFGLARVARSKSPIADGSPIWLFAAPAFESPLQG